MSKMNNSASGKEDRPCDESKLLDHVLRNYDYMGTGISVQNRLKNALNCDSVCLICIDDISKTDSIWSCQECSSFYHLNCIQKWAKDSIYFQESAFEENPGRNALVKEFNWVCPKCRHAYLKSDIPLDYFCFCKKEKNPAYDPWLLPHSCGEICGKKLENDCGHTCLLLCHPGKCPPCPAMVVHACFCVSANRQSRRCSSKAWSCGGTCARPLICGQHKCQQVCHEPPCEICPKTSVQKCRCGSASKVLPCSNFLWQCDKICGKSFSCGHHNCDRICHAGSCGECPDTGKRFCPCGKKSFSLPCTETVPSCGDTCGKDLVCSAHKCAERCHRGPCPPCFEVCTKKCRCGTREKELPCAKDFICEIKCKRLRDCRKHHCNKKCCIGECATCDQPCGKLLPCGQHRCQSRCHQMRCFPCSVTKVVKCPCGGTSVEVPCGRKGASVRPRCHLQCRKPSSCRHADGVPHLCHSGDCPRCALPCGAALSCGHTCDSICHDAVPVKVESTRKITGPWDIIPPKIEIQSQPCPPCKVKVTVPCLGLHKSLELLCSEKRLMSCGSECGNALQCGNHFCQQECHAIKNSGKPNKNTSCKQCSKLCTKSRNSGCRHPCNLPCHAGDCPLCVEWLRMKCHCGLLDSRQICSEWVALSPEEQERKLSCTNRCNKAMECGHLCVKECHSGACSTPADCREKIPSKCPCKRRKKMVPCVEARATRLTCDEECKKKELNENLKSEMKKEGASATSNSPQPRKKEKKDKGSNKQSAVDHKNLWIVVSCVCAYGIAALLYIYLF